MEKRQKLKGNDRIFQKDMDSQTLEAKHVLNMRKF